MVIVIGISGPTTSGKSTISEKLQQKFNCKIICVDNYFKINSEMPKVEINGLTILDFDDKDAIEWNYLIEDIEKEKIKSKDFLIVEGFLLFGDPKIYDIIDILINISFDTEKDEEIAFKRRLNRFKWEGIRYNQIKNNKKDDDNENLKKYEEEEEIPEDYETNPEKNRLNYLAFYFKHVAWPHIKENQELVCPLNWEKPVLKLSATANLQDNIQKSFDFINSNKPTKCRI